MSRLTALCARHLADTLCVDTVVETFCEADARNQTALKNHCVSFMRAHFYAVLHSPGYQRLALSSEEADRKRKSKLDNTIFEVHTSAAVVVNNHDYAYNPSSSKRQKLSDTSNLIDDGASFSHSKWTTFQIELTWKIDHFNDQTVQCREQSKICSYLFSTKEHDFKFWLSLSITPAQENEREKSVGLFLHRQVGTTITGDYPTTFEMALLTNSPDHANSRSKYTLRKFQTLK